MFLNRNKTQKSNLNHLTNTLIHQPTITTNKDNNLKTSKKSKKFNHC